MNIKSLSQQIHNSVLKTKYTCHYGLFLCFLPTANLGGFCFGTALGYSSPAGPQLMDNSTNADFVLTVEQNSWFSSSINLGAVIGGPIGGVCINILGRRGTMLMSVVFILTSWIIIGKYKFCANKLSGTAESALSAYQEYTV